ncbi:response regulator [Paenibacillaceae bacterium]|nr:response regulator [Paenibacillaceae bacterium]
MIRLLIVDDEPYTVDGLFEMLENTESLELDIYRAYSPEEAQEWLLRTRMDIVLSDIRMPGMTGLELQQWILAQWPRCKIIFLTGIRDLQTAQQAVRSGTVDYILKTEGDEAILRSIRRAIAELSSELRSEQFIHQAKGQMQLARPVLQREWLVSLVEGKAHAEPPGKAVLQRLEIPLDHHRPLMLVFGRVDCWHQEGAAEDQLLLLYALQNIAAEFLEGLVLFPVNLDHVHFFWLAQPARQVKDAAGAADGAAMDDDGIAAGSDPVAGKGTGAAADIAWRRTVAFVQGMLETIQQTCQRLLKLSVSFISAPYAIPWEELPQAYQNMKKQIVLGLGTGTEMLMTADFQKVDKYASTRPQPLAGETLGTLLENGMEEAFAAAVRAQFAGLSTNYIDYLQAYYTIVALLLGSVAAADCTDRGEPALDMDRLTNIANHPTKEAALAFLLDAAAALFARRRQLKDERTHQFVNKLHHYIQTNLGGDLSLTRLSEVVFLNPTYLSVLYKQQTGINLSEYIADLRIKKAKELLEQTPLKIQEIAERVGFETAGYFTRFFKKHLNRTPQEYRSNP